MVFLESLVDRWNRDLGDGASDQIQCLKAVRVRTDEREPFAGVHAVEEAVELSVFDGLDEPKALRVQALEWRDIVNVVGEDPNFRALRPHIRQS